MNVALLGNLYALSQMGPGQRPVVQSRACNASFPATQPPTQHQLDGCVVYFPGTISNDNNPLNPDNLQYHSDYHHSGPRRGVPYQ